MRIPRIRLFIGIHFNHAAYRLVLIRLCDLRYESWFRVRGIPVSCTDHVAPSLFIPLPTPLGGSSSSRAVTPLLPYYESVRLPYSRFRSLSSSVCRRISRLRETAWISQVHVLSFRTHTAVSDPGREDSISPYRCSPCCLLVSGDYGPLQQVTFRGSIPSLSLRSSYSLRAASSFPVTGYDALLVPGCRLNVTWAGLQPARNHTLILAHPEQLPKMISNSNPLNNYMMLNGFIVPKDKQ